jgi:hypothetical protein
VRFLLDQDVPEDLSYLLRELNHEILRVRDVLPPDAVDPDVSRVWWKKKNGVTSC